MALKILLVKCLHALKYPKKQGYLVGQQQKILQFFHRANFMTFKNEENVMENPYTYISSKRPCAVCSYFFKTLILAIFMNVAARDNTV